MCLSKIVNLLVESVFNKQMTITMTFMMASAINVGKGDGNDGDNKNKVYKKYAEEKISLGGRQWQRQWTATTMDG